MALKVLAQPSLAATQKSKAVQSIAGASAAATMQIGMVDELVRLTVELDKLDSKFKRRDELKKEFSKLANEEFADNEKAIFNGSVGIVQFSTRSELRKLENMNELIGKLKDVIGYEGLLNLLKLTLGDCEQYLSKEELAAYIKVVPGSRTFKGVTVTDPELAGE